ncbi:hypothetical protein CONLIGDRAFT_628229 [Coniochaeta ligniaria NRRL 30616]|uniref:Uncharacterized protein n=1 Tax=Coniochaeta ligniaria NRRL 30616 TaxID=1408157 RepID=A0A1J7JIY7_9PEZI|nr:hypothetical protein CONLIGDRAFT_628229 [Coniochaeta ligniaria NRRL 30616]
MAIKISRLTDADIPGSVSAIHRQMQCKDNKVEPLPRTPAPRCWHNSCMFSCY